MVASLLVMVIFNVQSIYDSKKEALEYKGGTEVVFNISQREGGAPLNENTIADKVAQRLDEAGSRNHKVEIFIREDDSSKGEIRVSLAGSETVNAMQNIVTVLSGNAPLTFTDSNNNEVSGATMFADKTPMQVLYNGTSATPAFNIGSKSDWNNLVSSASTSSNEDLQKIIYVWQNKSETDTYELAYGDNAREDVKKKIIAVLTSDNFVDSKDGCYVALTEDLNNQAFTISSARAFVAARNGGDYGFDIEYVYSNSIDAIYPSNSMNWTLLGTLIALIVIFVCFIIYYRVSGLLAGLTTVIGVMFTFLIANTLGFEFTPVTILSGILVIILAIFIVVTYFERIKGEIKRGKSVDKASYDGYRKAFGVILQSSLIVFFTSLILFLVGKGMVKVFFGVLLLGSLSDFIFVNLLTRWLVYWLTTSTVFSKNTAWFGFGSENNPDKIQEKIDKKKYLSTSSVKRGKILTLSTVGAISALVLGVFLGLGLTKGINNIYNYSGDYGPTNRLNISYRTDRNIDDGDTFVTYDSAIAYIEKDEEGLARNWFTSKDVLTHTFNRIADHDSENKETYSTYISFTLKNPLSTETVNSIRENFLAGGYKDMIPSEYNSDTVVSYDIVTVGLQGHDNFFAYLTVGLIPALTFIFFLLIYGLYAGLSSLIVSATTFGLGLSLLAVTNLPFTSVTMFGLASALLVGSMAMIPLFNRNREEMRASNIKNPSIETRTEILDKAIRGSSLTIYILFAVSFALFLGVLLASLNNMLSTGVIALIVLVANILMTTYVLPASYLFFVKVIKLRPLSARKLARKKNEDLINSKEPHETIVPGVND